MLITFSFVNKFDLLQLPFLMQKIWIHNHINDFICNCV
jgi:hypothetical protein